ncbi:polymorphic toxin-type HINT domain-containing protein [Streptomyces sp. NPDC089799]|uniref:polymorphic toxin-type HINT domain-containing protein n=1 Tax=Streptomyces sp. NPDC089799 TaxID=3155066 RepID=UPI0034352BF4
MLFSATADEAGPARIQVDYGTFASVIGGGWSTRLALASLPSCALTTPEKSECRKTTLLTSDNSVKNRTVTGIVPAVPKAVAGADPAVFAVMADASSAGKGAGDYKATPLSSSSNWEAGQSSGAFSWSYPITTPPAVAGPAPSLALSYDSGRVDGRTANTNNQTSLVGEGFDLTSSYIERKYGSCDDDGQKDKFDLCWKYENASLVLNGKATELVKDDTSKEWRLKNDDASKVTLETGADNGDENGEYWKVVTGDGTTYTFGLNKLTGAAAQRTNSTWTVPVFGDDSGEPGYNKGSSFSTRSEVQAWRWNLDLVQDLRGNASTYWYTAEGNNYAKNGDKTKLASYTAGGYLNEIRYGQRADALFTGVTSNKVTFGYKPRCVIDECGTLTKDTSSKWPDVPFDAICDAGETDCKATGPGFFTRKRLTSINTHAWNTTAEPDAYATIDTWDLVHDFWDAADLSDASDKSLILLSIKRWGKNGGSLELPPVEFTYQERPNRVDTDSDDTVPLSRPRIETITSEAGAITTVTLSDPECIRGSRMPKAEDDNSDAGRPCYPVYWPVNGGDPKLDWFHKYRVTAVTVADPATDQEMLHHSYEYEQPGWHYNDDPLTPEKERTWSTWRGYGKVTSYSGAVGTTRSKTVNVFMQGLHGDKLKAGGSRTAVVTGVAVPGVTVANANDYDQYAGSLRQSITHNGTTPIGVTVNGLWSKETASQQKSYANTKAHFVRTSAVYAYTHLTASGTANTWRGTQTDYTYDGVFGMKTHEAVTGDIAKSGDELCTRTWYARNDSNGITSLVSRTRTVGAPCTQTDDKLNLPTSADVRGDVLSDEAVVYDNAGTTGWSPTQAPTLGLPTWTGRAQSYPAASGTGDRHPAVSGGWQTVAKTTYDTATAKLGRPLSVTNAEGQTTTTSYTPAAAGPLVVSVATGPKLASNGQQHTSYTYVDLRGSTVRSIDANMKSAFSTYDALGRITETRLPNRPQSFTPNIKYGYQIARGKEPWTSVSTLANNEGYRTTYSIADALLRPVQTQTESPGGGRILTDTRYDTRGLAHETHTDIYDSTKAPEGRYARAENGESPLQTQTAFDGAGRATTSTLYTFGAKKWSTTTSYTGDSVATTAPQGGTAARTITDALGRTVETRTYGGTTPDDPAFGGTSPGTPYTKTTQSYTRNGKLRFFNGIDGSQWSYNYDLFGRQNTTTDPDKGTATTSFTALDQVATTKDSRNTVLEFDYDELGRKTGLWKTSKTDGNKLAAWTYDTVLKGAPSESIRYYGGTAGKAYTNAVTEYDLLSRPVKTQLRLPADDPLVTSGATAATTEHRVSYLLDGSLSSTDAPAGGGLPAEILSYDYNTFGLPTGLTGTTGYVENAAYNPLGDLQQLTLARSGASGVKQAYVTNTYEDGTRRLIKSLVTGQAHNGLLQELTYKYDQSGNVLSVFDAAPQSGFTQADNQCFTYDGQRRLTEAWTPKTADCSTAGRTAANLGGAAPYWSSYTYTASGQRATEKTTPASGGAPITRTYCYDATRKHALAATTTAASCTGLAPQYAYDAAGNTIKRQQDPAGTTAQTLTWSPEGQLSKLTEGSTSTDYLYDADGELLIRRLPGGETVLYNGATEVHLKGATKWATRTYGFAGQPVAVRTNETGTSKLSFLAGDRHGTSSLAIDSADTQALSKRYTTPFGGQRGSTVGTWPDDKRFLGATEDKNTGLTHIGAREYDPALGQFISIDPLLEADKHQTLNGYSYSINNPLSFTDPTGLGTACSGSGRASEACPRTMPGGQGRPDGGNAHDDGDQYEQAQYVPSRFGGGSTPGENYGYDFNNDGVVAIHPKFVVPVTWKQLPELAETFSAEILTLCRYKDAGDCYTGSDGDDNASVSSSRDNACRDVYGGTCPGGYQVGDRMAASLMVGAEQRFGSGRAKGPTSSGNCKCFLAGTDVLMADGTTKDIEDINVGDKVQATDPETGESGPREVAKLIVTEDDKHFNELTLTTQHGNEKITATHEHPFWSPSDHRWVEAGDLKPNTTLQTRDGTVTVLANRAYSQSARTYNLTVDGLHTYYVLAGATPVLVHNSSCLTTAGNNFPGVAHTLDEHVGISNARAISLAASKPGGKNSVFIDHQTAQQVADYAVAFNQTRINKWLRGSQQQLTFSGRFGAHGSLGTTFYANGSSAATGNGYFIQLTRAKGHPGGFYVSTLYPK